MDFWNNATNFFWGQESFSLLVMMLCVSTLLFYFRTEDRISLFNTLGFYFACLFGLLISGILHAMEFMRAGDILHEVFIIGAGIAIIRLLGQFVFRLILPAVKLTPPPYHRRLIRDRRLCGLVHGASALRRP